MMIKDVIPGFELYRPVTIADAVVLLDEHKADVWKLAGGNNVRPGLRTGSSGRRSSSISAASPR